MDPTGYRLGTFITTMRDAAKAGRLEAHRIAELDALGMIWDKHDAAWRSCLAAAADYHRAHGHLAAPATTPVGTWLAEQRHLATKGELDPRPRRGPHRTRPRLAPAARSGLAPQIPPPARPPRHRRRPRHPHP
ncbi:helicase associated domain-containing protein [Streptomyces griseoluteus]|uniref:helicase associated domain-containing protein n=1 Tax=Streptomyces griseoluteus TaxID=29306 RepID=UPI001FCC8B4D|nr:helicase associated domain-containing protein [Streptomyces griseoluteus]